MGNAAYSSEALSARTLEKLAESLARERGWLMIRSDKKLNNQNVFQLVDLRARGSSYPPWIFWQ
jgi:hypothetical protein